MLRLLLIVHRYLAVAVGLLMALWCLSGFVMLYQDYPQLTRAEQLQGLEPLDLAACCRSDFLPADAETLHAFRIEMLNGMPLLRQSGVRPFQLRNGEPLPGLQQDDVLHVAAEHARRRGISGTPRLLGPVDVDQWTLQTFQRQQPAQHLALQDAAGTELYVNSATGEVFQDTNRRERLLSWLGAIPHWLYPTFLRRNGPLWSKIVIWTSIAGCFLAATGLYVGISRLRRRASDGRLSSPFHGWWYWHHVAGLCFGVLVLTWVFSGLLSMNPWGLLEGSEAGGRVASQLSRPVPTAELRQFLQALPQLPDAGQFRRLRAEDFDGHLYVIAERADGSVLRLDAAARPAPLTQAAVRELVARLDTGLRSLELMTVDDAYYYSHKEPAGLPVYRAILDDASRTRLYIRPATGEVRIVDIDARRARWWQRALHGLDFRGLRTRPLWDIVAMLLLAGATLVTVTGSWMAIQRVRRDLGRR
ncbi:MAG TPA: PepSY domain-containing protein [Steroidobacteraceae bacterium]|nr:PepSY domain-containing protein [Steroidobacteraceae bacterium]